MRLSTLAYALQHTHAPFQQSLTKCMSIKKNGGKTSKEKLEIKVLEPVPISYEPVLE